MLETGEGRAGEARQFFFSAHFRLHRLSPSSPFVCLPDCPSYLPLSCSPPLFIAPFLQLSFVFFALTSQFALVHFAPLLRLYQCSDEPISRRHWEGQWVNLLWMTFKNPTRCGRHKLCYWPKILIRATLAPVRCAACRRVRNEMRNDKTCHIFCSCLKA